MQNTKGLETKRDMLALRQESSLDMRFFWQVIRRRARICSMYGVLLGGLAAMLLWAIHKPLYEATAWIQLQSNPQHLAFEQPSLGGSPEELTLKLQTQLEMVRSPLVIERVADEPRLQELEIDSETLEQDVTFWRVRGSEIHVIQYSHPEPEIAAFVVNRIAEVYDELQTSDAASRAERLVELIEQEKRQRYAEIEKSRHNLRTLFARRPELVMLVGKDEFSMEFVQKLRTSLLEAQVAAEVLKAKLATDRAALNERQLDITQAMIEEKLDQKPQVIELTKLLIKKESARAGAIAAASGGNGEESATVVADSEIEVYRNQLREMRDRLRSDVVADLEDAAALDLANEIRRQELELQRSEGLVKELEKQFFSYVDTVGVQDSSLVDAAFMNRELQRAEAMYESLDARLNAVATEMNAPPPARIIWRAEVPTEPETPFQIVLELATVFLAGFLFPFAVAVLMDRRSHRIYDLYELQQLRPGFSLPFVAATARVSDEQLTFANGRPSEDSMRVFEESVDSLWTQLLVAHETPPQVVAVASAVEGEGKTRLAANLSVKFAQWCEEPVLVIDADLRSPGIHRFFDLRPQDNGLVDVLSGNCSSENAIVELLGIPRLSCMASGAPQENPLRLFYGSAFSTLLEHLRQSHRFIIVNVPPLLSASESLLIASAADGVLMCARWEKSYSDQVQWALKRLESAGAPVIGAVLNGVPTRKYVHAYGYYRNDAGGEFTPRATTRPAAHSTPVG